MDNITLSTPHNKALYTSPSPSSSDHHHHHPYHHYLMSNQSPNLALNLNDDDDDYGAEHEEPMFEKPLTPSDVGKLNRLVIPKQHAEKYFPLGGESGAEKGLLLSFEDEAGKTWRFRYSYWNSSQSYVLTKGWSRYVKEKRLDAGDVVLFKRHRADAERLFIGWRRRASTGPAPGQDGRLPGAYPAHRGHAAAAGHYRNNRLGAGVAPYQPDCIHAGMVSPAQSQTTSLGNSNINSTNTSSKILRLFGVNMECPYHHEHASAEEASAPDGAGHTHHFYHSANHFSETQYHDHMDFSFAGDVNPMRDRRG